MNDDGELEAALRASFARTASDLPAARLDRMTDVRARRSRPGARPGPLITRGARRAAVGSVLTAAVIVLLVALATGGDHRGSTAPDPSTARPHPSTPDPTPTPFCDALNFKPLERKVAADPSLQLSEAVFDRSLAGVPHGKVLLSALVSKDDLTEAGWQTGLFPLSRESSPYSVVVERGTYTSKELAGVVSDGFGVGPDPRTFGWLVVVLDQQGRYLAATKVPADSQCFRA